MNKIDIKQFRRLRALEWLGSRVKENDETTEIFTGTLDKKGDIEVTDETFTSMVQYCIEHHKSMDFEYKGGRYRLLVQEVKE